MDERPDPNAPDQDEGIVAYHGSPHDFDQFNLSKIGTGEGAQAYGHGLYFAESEPIAKFYRDSTRPNLPQVIIDNKNTNVPLHQADFLIQNMVREKKTPEEYYESLANSVGAKEIEKKLATADREDYGLGFSDYDLAKMEYDSFQRSLNDIRSYFGKDIQVRIPEGHMYEVRVAAHPDHFLDWDKPLSEQSQYVTRGLFNSKKENPTLWSKLSPHFDLEEAAGDVYKKLAAIHPNGQAGASEWLQAAGLKGIRYLDAGSRSSTDAPTRNYVVFDDKHVSVRRKYEQGGAVQSMATGGEVDGGEMNPTSVEHTGNGIFNVFHEGKKAGTISIARNGEGNFVSAANLDEPFMGKGVGHAAYNLIEQKIGKKIAPSPLGISPAASKFWQKRLKTLSPDERQDLYRATRQAGLDYGLPARDVNLRLYGIAGSESLPQTEEDPDITKATGGEVGDETPYHQTPEFQNWFGDSVAHTDGVPMTYYHGTSKDKDYTSFNIGKHGLWLTADPAEASSYAEQNDSQGYTYDDGKYVKTNTAARVLPVHIKAENPYRGDKPEEMFQKQNYKKAQSDWFEQLRSQGYDSWIPDSQKGSLAVILKAPTQIKSIYNRTFDPKNKRMDKAAGGETGQVSDVPQIDNAVSVFPKPQRMFPEDAPVPGGMYLNAATKEDMTGHKAAMASIGVQPGGKPYFRASPDSVDETGTPGRGSAMAKTNLFKQRAGWKWAKAPEGHEATDTIVSVQHRGQHHYTLNAHFPKGVDLARYEKSPTEPRLRPTTQGNVTLGPQVGSILVRGKEHPVYEHVIVKSTGGEVSGKKAAGGSAVATLRRMSDPAVNEAIRVINRSGSSPRDAVTLSKRLLGRQ